MMQDSPPLPLPLERLLRRLRAQGFYIGLDTLVRLRHYWQDVVEQPGFRTAQLKPQLAALLCRSSDEQEKFYATFDDYLPAKPEPVSFENIPKPPPPPVIAPRPETEPEILPPPDSTQPPPDVRRTAAAQQDFRGPILPPLTFPSDLPRVWNLPELGPALLPLLEKEWAETIEWDVPETIRQTIHAGGIPMPAFRRRKRAPRYLILIEQQSPRDHLAGFGLELARELSRRDLETDYYFFTRTPARCWKNLRNPRSHVFVEYLRAEWEQARLLVIGSAAALTDPATHRPSNLALDLLDWWPRTTLLCSGPTTDWGPDEQALNALLPVVPLHPGGLRTLMTQWNGTESFDTAFWQQKLPEPIPPALTPNRAHSRDDIVVDLYRYLGEDAFRWLCAAAIYPELYYELTAIFHDEAMPPQSDLSEWEQNAVWHRALLRLSRLDWLRQGYLPEAMRRDLRNRLKNNDLALIETELRRILNWSNNAVHDENSYAAVEREEIFGWLLQQQGGEIAAKKPAEKPPVQQQTDVPPTQTESRAAWMMRGAEASKAVCKVTRADGEMATGFLTGDHYLFTVSYLLNNPEEAREASAEFNYELTAEGQRKQVVSYRLDPSDFSFSDRGELCFTRVKIIDNPDNPLSQWGALEFERENVPAEGESLQIIHHPEGKEKDAVLDDCAVIAHWNQYLFYSPLTRPGSGGAPVFNRDWKVVAIHRARRGATDGGMQINDKGDRLAASQGVLMRDILAFLDRGGGKTAPAATHRALWIDDRPENASEEQTALRAAFDLAFFNARNLEEALGALGQGAPFQFAISDLSREGEENAAFQTLRALHERIPGLPIIFYTDKRGMNLQEPLLTAGAYRVTDDRETLRQAIGELLQPPEAAGAPPPAEEAQAEPEPETPPAQQEKANEPPERVIQTESANALEHYLEAIKGLIQDGELEDALTTLSDLDKKTGAGFTNDLIMLSGSYRQTKRLFDQGTADDRSFRMTMARTQASLLSLLDEVPKRIALNAKVRGGGLGLDAFQFTVPKDEKWNKLLPEDNNLLKIAWLEAARQAAKTVCRVVFPDGTRASGFLTKSGHIFINSDVLETRDHVRLARVEFGYKIDADGKISGRVAYELDIDDFISSEPNELDFARVKVKDRTDAPLSQWGFVDFETAEIPSAGEAVTIVQHPGNEVKPMDVDAGTVLSVWDNALFYDLNTEPGSSGSPIFNRNWKIVALHGARSDKMTINDKGDQRPAGRGILFRDILAFIDSREQSKGSFKRPTKK